jgi:hypothetical protein
MTLFDLIIYGAQQIPDNVQIITGILGRGRREDNMEIERPTTPDHKENKRKRKLSINDENVSKKHISST